ncbi:MAG: hypothetical protein R3C02_07665 [Planctomycetaceae bacterium]
MPVLVLSDLSVNFLFPIPYGPTRSRGGKMLVSRLLRDGHGLLKLAILSVGGC